MSVYLRNLTRLLSSVAYGAAGTESFKNCVNKDVPFILYLKQTQRLLTVQILFNFLDRTLTF